MGSVLVSHEQPHFTPEFLHGQFVFAKHFREHHGGLLPQTPFWLHLEHKWEIAPKRFEHWHPIAGRWLKIDHELRTHHQVLPPNQPPHTESIPEPSSCVLLATAVAALIWRAMR